LLERSRFFLRSENSARRFGIAGTFQQFVERDRQFSSQ
jgi:hypothetical protein